MGYLCRYCLNSLVPGAFPAMSLPTFTVGESGEANSGYIFSSDARSLIIPSYSKSDIWGSFST